MVDIDKEQLRPLYSEFQGSLSQAPNFDKFTHIYSADVWQLVNVTIDELSKISGEDYSRYKIIPKTSGQTNREFVETDTYRTKLGSLISRLHGKYFSNEPAPFSGMPSTIISQSQQQSQSFQVQLLLEIQSKIDEQLHNLKSGDKKRSFLEKVKGSLKSVRNT